MASFGFYGKIPSEGDFVTRRLPWDFTAAWDEWLQQGMQASRAALGERWLEVYLSAPIWRFHAAPGVFGPQGWRGLFFASVDRVGRYFPLALAVADGSAPSIESLSADEVGWLAAEDAALAALARTLSIEDFDRSLDALAAPASPPQFTATGAAPQRLCLYLPAGEDQPAITHCLAELPGPDHFTQLLSPAAAPPESGSLVDLL